LIRGVVATVMKRKGINSELMLSYKREGKIN